MEIIEKVADIILSQDFIEIISEIAIFRLSLFILITNLEQKLLTIKFFQKKIIKNLAGSIRISTPDQEVWLQPRKQARGRSTNSLIYRLAFRYICIYRPDAGRYSEYIVG